jgi:adenylyltransferase/sulfurtransferase
VVGLGALGAAVADRLTRAGVGYIRLIDFDHVELDNLQRQCLYNEDDARKARPKAKAALEHLRAINSDIKLEAVEAKLEEANAADLLGGLDIVLDGTDNMDPRYVINSCCVNAGIPWVQGGVVMASGSSFTILPGGPCFRCMYPEKPPRGTYPIAGTHGIISPIATFIGAVEATEAIKILSGHPEAVRKTLLTVDLWDNGYEELPLEKNPDCPVCGH